MNLPRLFVDYNTVGHAVEFTAPVFREERERLSVGQQVIVEGDSVDDRVATIIAIEGAEVRLRFDDQPETGPHICTELQPATISRTYGNLTILGVPTSLCLDCGETYFSEDVLLTLDSLIRSGQTGTLNWADT